MDSRTSGVHCLEKCVHAAEEDPKALYGARACIEELRAGCASLAAGTEQQR